MNMQTPIKITLKYWKDKTKAVRGLSEIYRLRLRRRDARIAKLEARIAELESIITPEQVYAHHYPAQMMALAVFTVVAGGSYRLAAKVVWFYAQMMGWSYGLPSQVTIRNWMMKCGLFAMEQSNQMGEQLTVIMDESIQIGKEKLLLLLGFPNTMHQTQCGELCHSDVRVLGMAVRTSWTGNAIAGFLKERMQTWSAQVTKVLSDRGTNLLKACKVLNIDHISDCSHHMMNAVKSIFDQDEALNQLCTQVGKLRQRLCMTDYAYLLPPTLRDKDRFCRMFQLVDWMERVKTYLVQDEQGAQQYLAFLSGTEALQNRLKQVRDLVQIGGQILRRCGLSEVAYQIWKQRATIYLKEQSQLSQAALSFVEHMNTYFEQHKALWQNGQRWLCCSEVIESIFGRYKNKGGMQVISADILAIPLYGQSISVQWVKKAMQETSINRVDEWRMNHVCMNRYGILKQIKKKQKATYDLVQLE